MNTEELKNKIKITDLIKLNNIEYKEQGEGIIINCISGTHDDLKPSMIVTDKIGKFYCHSCKESGDIFDIAKLLNLGSNFPEIKKYIESNLLQHELIITEDVNNKQDTIDKDEIYFEILDYICSYFENHLTNEIRSKYLTGKKTINYKIYRGSVTMSGYGFENKSIEKYRLGYCPNSKDLYNQVIKKYGEKILDKYMIGEKLLGIFTKRGMNLFKNRIVFPVIYEGKIVSFTSRQTEYTPSDEYSSQKYMLMSGCKDYLFNEQDFNNDYIFLTEGISDCISLVEKGYNTVASMTTGISTKIFNRIKEKLIGVDVYILFDSDINKSGDKGAEKLSQSLSNEGIHNKIIRLPLNKNKKKLDINEYFLTNTKKDFMILLWEQIT